MGSVDRERRIEMLEVAFAQQVRKVEFLEARIRYLETQVAHEAGKIVGMSMRGMILAQEAEKQ